jgi:hypothetical protein
MKAHEALKKSKILSKVYEEETLEEISLEILKAANRGETLLPIKKNLPQNVKKQIEFYGYRFLPISTEESDFIDWSDEYVEF